MNIELYTDGSATTIDKPGGWAYVLVIDGKKHSENNGYYSNATNNDMELQAVIEGLKAVQSFLTLYNIEHPRYPTNMQAEPTVTVKSDSQLILGWTSGQYAFKQQDKIEKYKELKALVGYTNAKTEWVRGHNGNEYNERCDKLANLARLQKQEEIKTKDAKERGDTLIGEKKKGVMCVWFKDVLKIIDLDKNIVEDYDRDRHGPRGSMFQILEDKKR